MRIIFMGNQQLGCDCLNWLAESRENVMATICLPRNYWRRVSDDTCGTEWFPSLEATAKKHGILTMCPDNINDPIWVQRIIDLRPDIIFSISWDQMLGEEILSIPPMGCVNVHGSLLPANRGHSPVNWAIIRGETRTGMTMHYMVRKADAGDIIGQRLVEIAFADTAKDVFDKITRAGRDLFREMYPLIREGRAPRFPQDITKGNYNKRRKPDDGIINWEKSAFDLYNWVRALTHPYPGAFTFVNGEKLFIWKATIVDNVSTGERPGTVVEVAVGRGVIIQTGTGRLLIESVQMEDEEVVTADHCFMEKGFETRLVLG